jgi:hypothetical protein
MKFNVLIMMTSGVTTHFRGQPFAVVMGVDGFLFSGFIPSFEPALEHQKKIVATIPKTSPAARKNIWEVTMFCFWWWLRVKKKKS